ncbi:hypothetical protein ACIA3K_20160 [Micromonospora sp. NPDC051543]|uniref:hypothetical protein n=1 Tax=Micromonospora sp. NPDC051543 TaxID=3364287 RepID=UPI0037B0DE2E
MTMLLLIQGLAVPEHRGLYRRLTIGVGWTWITAFALHLRRNTPTYEGEATDQKHAITRSLRQS